MIKPMPRDSEIYAQVKRLCEKRNSEALAKNLIAAGESGAKAQQRLALTIQQIADDHAGPSAIPSLGETILIQQSHAIANYGEKARPLTQRQIEAVVRDAISCFPVKFAGQK